MNEATPTVAEASEATRRVYKVESQTGLGWDVGGFPRALWAFVHDSLLM